MSKSISYTRATGCPFYSFSDCNTKLHSIPSHSIIGAFSFDNANDAPTIEGFTIKSHTKIAISSTVS